MSANWVPSLQRFQSFLDLLQSSLQPSTEKAKIDLTTEQWAYVIIQIKKSLVRCKNYIPTKTPSKFI